MRFLAGVLTLALAAAPRLLLSQERGAAALGDAIAGMGTTARVLMIGAHPDDEDTQLIAWLTRGRHVETAYLSLTRGDGGQNLIGNELGPALGVIRTEELLAARRVDGGRQYFTRAYDFGFSKSAAETYKHWPHDSLLKDVVTVVRAFRPHVIVAVFTGTPLDGHGHHQVSGQLAREAFDLAADTVRFPRSATAGNGAWGASKFYRGTYFTTPDQASVTINVGEYSPLLGRSYGEVAAESRSQHLSQGFGIVQTKGARLDRLRLEASRTGASPNAKEMSMFDGIDTSWARFRSLALPPAVRAAIDSLATARAEVMGQLDLVDPSKVVAPLARYLRLVQSARRGERCAEDPVPVCDGPMADLTLALDLTISRATQALLAAAGVAVEVFAEREIVASSDSATVTTSVFNQGRAAVSVNLVSMTSPSDASILKITDAGERVLPDSAFRRTLTLKSGVAPTAPWWLTLPRKGDVFDLPITTGESVAPVPQLVVGEDRLQSSTAHVLLSIAGTPVDVNVSPIVYRYADPARGELRRPIATVPAVSVLLDREIEYARAAAPLERTVRVMLRSGVAREQMVSVALALPRGVTADSATRSVTLAPFASAEVNFHVRGTLPVGRHTISATATAGGGTYSSGYVSIEYPHIRPQRLYRDARVAVEAVDMKVPATTSIAYIQGVGDNSAPMLTQLGINVTMLDPARIPQTDLSKFSAIVIGTRAYSANPALVANNARLLQYVRDGGRMIVQYGQQEMTRPGIMPFPIELGRTAERVTEEDAAVRVLDPSTPLLGAPNRIEERDFRGWVQERALYMPSAFDPKYRTVLSMNDAGEKPNDAAILVAPVGKGVYVYTTLAFFRQLPSGNPGAARLFMNLLDVSPAAATRPAPPAATPVP